MTKRYFVFLTVFALAFALTNFSLAQKPEVLPDQGPPDEEGTYDVPGRPDLKVRVHVYPAKDIDKARPGQEPLVYQPVCKFDLGSDAVVSPAGWHLKLGDWKYKLNTASVPASVGGSLGIIADRAFDEWQFKTDLSGKVNFVPEGITFKDRKALDGQNIIAWGRTSGSALAVTYTWYYVNSKEVAETDTIFNKKYPWSWTDQSSSPTGKTCADQNSYDAQDVLTHELGHWIGLNDHYTAAYVNNTMYGYGIKGEANATTLTVGDIAGVNALY